MQISCLENFLQKTSAASPVARDVLLVPRPCLLVVDDELARAGLTRVLRARDFDVESAASGEDALNCAGQFRREPTTKVSRI
jgi:PleD family two-component response regulator